ncbi:hypothetical protein M885DRAFT_506422 [Pelagophyceae sp. CCMP2097]|nr:hypothetical protein M885DRAFT_506422 [Pelagophyceae sp. CCMP2097]
MIYTGSDMLAPGVAALPSVTSKKVQQRRSDKAAVKVLAAQRQTAALVDTNSAPPEPRAARAKDSPARPSRRPAMVAPDAAADADADAPRPEGFARESVRDLRRDEAGSPRASPLVLLADGGLGATDEDEDYVAQMERLAAMDLSEDKLWKIAGTRRLDTITEITLSLRSSSQSFANVGELLPNLVELVLDGSELASLRDLGTGLQSLKSLSLARCGMRELDGMSALPRLNTLDVAHNHISDLDALSHHEHLQVLDARGNKLCDLQQLEVLGTCALLYALHLQGNALQTKLESETYAKVVCFHIPSLRALDGKHVKFQGLVDEADLDAAADALAANEAEPPARGAAVGGATLAQAGAAPGAEPWRAVLGTKKRPTARQPHILESDPSASALTLDGNTAFAGSALAMMRRRALPAPHDVTSVCSTLDDALRLDEAQRQPAPGGDHQRLLQEWAAESAAFAVPDPPQRSSSQGSAASEPRAAAPGAACPSPSALLKRRAAARPRTAPMASPSGRRGFHFDDSPLASAGNAHFFAAAPGGHRPKSSFTTSSRAPLGAHESPSPRRAPASRPQSASSAGGDAAPDMVLPEPVFLPDAERARTLVERPSSRRTSRRRAFCDDSEDDNEETPGAFAHNRAADSAPRPPHRPPAGAAAAWQPSAESEDEGSDGDAPPTRAAIKAQVAANAARPPRPPTDRAAPGRKSAAAAKIGFDLAGSLAALTTWSDAAADDDDGAVRFARAATPASAQGSRPSTASSFVDAPVNDAPANDAHDARRAARRADGARGASQGADSARGAVESGAERQPRVAAAARAGEAGRAGSLDDAALVAMLRQPPKAVRHLRTRDGFRAFFAGVSTRRMQNLLEAAFHDQPEADRARRLQKRLALLEGVLFDDDAGL